MASISRLTKARPPAPPQPVEDEPIPARAQPLPDRDAPTEAWLAFTGVAVPVDPTPGAPRTGFNWTIEPGSLGWGARFLHERYKLPVAITENGIGTDDDDPTAHAEIVAMRQAATRVKNYRLSGATLIVTLPGKPRSIRTCLDAIFPAIPYCLDLMEAARLETDPARLVAFRPSGG